MQTLKYLWPLKIYFFLPSGRYDKRDVLTIFDEDHLKANVHHIKRHFDNGMEVMVTDAEEYAIFHAKQRKILYPPNENSEYFLYSNPLKDKLKEDKSGLYVPVYRKDGEKRWRLRKEAIALPYQKAIIWYRDWLREQYEEGLNEERKLVKQKTKSEPHYRKV